MSKPEALLFLTDTPAVSLPALSRPVDESEFDLSDDSCHEYFDPNVQDPPLYERDITTGLDNNHDI